MPDNNASRGFITTGGFNTGRLYTKHGQRIYWGARVDGWVHFTDCDRMISGWMHRETPGCHSAPVLPGWLMGRYDRHQYVHSPDSECHDDLPPIVPDGFDFGDPLRI